MEKIETIDAMDSGGFEVFTPSSLRKQEIEKINMSGFNDRGAPEAGMRIETSESQANLI